MGVRPAAPLMTVCRKPATRRLPARLKLPNSKPPEARFKCGHCQGNIVGVHASALAKHLHSCPSQHPLEEVPPSLSLASVRLIKYRTIISIKGHIRELIFIKIDNLRNVCGGK